MTTINKNICFVFMLILFTLMQKIVLQEWANGVRYPRVGGTRQRHFAGTNSKPHKRLENAATPTRRVHAVLGRHELRKTR
ncbi:MAG TPA: hypothetical protein VK206_20860 [Anaerolineales bacterium]|nr:hypothetical protein [Anaerolineales bacterium]HLO32341.1 hypothetical protein [Anaerolineales bacterium]